MSEYGKMLNMLDKKLQDKYTDESSKVDCPLANNLCIGESCILLNKDCIEKIRLLDKEKEDE